MKQFAHLTNMQIKYYLLLAVFLSGFISVGAQEGHPNWWWDSKGADFIVEGVITYDPANYYEINPVKIEGKDGKYYWIVGNVKINKVLFINKDSRHLESYRQYFKNSDKSHPMLIPSYQRATFSSQSRPAFLLYPILGLDIIKEPTILNLSQIYIFPILDLKLESVVPKENISEAMGLIEKRPNNYLVN